MKNLIMFLSLFVILLLTTSCTKEDPIITEPVVEETTKDIGEIFDTNKDNDSGDDNDDPTIFTPVLSRSIQVHIKTSACSNSTGVIMEAVIRDDFVISGNSVYEVEWFQYGKKIGKGQQLTDCVCGDDVKVIVRANHGWGAATATPPICEMVAVGVDYTVGVDYNIDN